MKKYLIGLMTALAAVSTSCNTLDFDPTTKYSDATAYSSIENLDFYIRDMYFIYHSVANVECGASLGMLEDSWTDLIKTSWYGVGQPQNQFFSKENSMNVGSNLLSNWGTMYSHILRFNFFLVDANVGRAKDLPKDELAVRVAEVRFLRAFAYMEMAKFYGGLVLRISEESLDDQNQNAKARASKEETWEFILNEFDKAAADLPDSWSDIDYGRITKMGALAMKSRAALYAGRWDEAYAAADEVIKSGAFELVTNVSDIYKNPANSEVIIPVLFEQQKKQHNYDTYLCPPCIAKAAGYEARFGAAATPTEEYASQFDIKVDGVWQAFNWDNMELYGNEPFKNRDPRFYESILANGNTFKGCEIQCWEGGTDECMTYMHVGQDNVHKSTTGYYVRKFLHASNEEGKRYNFVDILSDQFWPEMRLAEVYLIRSESAAKLDKWGEAYEDLNTIRARAGLPGYTPFSTWERYLDALQKERICELGLEGHRFVDIIRWGISDVVLDGQRTHGVKVTRNDDGSFSYQVIEADNYDRIFPKSYEVFPIPYSEIQNNPLCEQNDGW